LLACLAVVTFLKNKKKLGWGMYKYVRALHLLLLGFYELHAFKFIIFLVKL